MSLEENKAIIRRFYDEVWNKGNVAVIDDIFAPDYIRHDLRPGAPPSGPEGQKAIARLFRAAFPDIQMTLDLLIAEGDLVVGRWTTQGTHTGEWAGVPPTGRRATFAGVNIFRIASGKVVEIWNHRDDLGLMEQLDAAVYAGYPDQGKEK